MKPKVHLTFVDRSDVLKDTLWGKIFLPSSQWWAETLVFTNTEINVQIAKLKRDLCSLVIEA